MSKAISRMYHPHWPRIPKAALTCLLASSTPASTSLLLLQQHRHESYSTLTMLPSQACIQATTSSLACALAAEPHLTSPPAAPEPNFAAPAEPKPNPPACWPPAWPNMLR
jgi:hypothetical protein